MNRRLMIRILELLEEVFPNNQKVGRLTKKLGLNYLNEEFSKVMAYLTSTGKITGIISNSGMKRLTFFPQDEVGITNLGIDSLTDIKKVEADESRNKLSLDSTIVLTQIAIVGIILALYEKLNLNLSIETNVPWLLSVVFWVILFSFFVLLLFKIFNIVFNKESWRGILLIER